MIVAKNNFFIDSKIRAYLVTILKALVKTWNEKGAKFILDSH